MRSDAQQPQRLVAVVGDRHLEAVALEVSAHDVAHDGVVVGDQDAGHHSQD